jgi:hypothetical protein
MRPALITIGKARLPNEVLAWIDELLTPLNENTLKVQQALSKLGVDNLNAQVFTSTVTPASEWVDLTASLTAPWVAGANPPMVRKRSDGVVDFTGNVNGGAAGGVIVSTLPAGYAPDQYRIFSVVDDGAAPGNGCAVSVHPTGTLVCFLDGGGLVGDLHLDITYVAADRSPVVRRPYPLDFRLADTFGGKVLGLLLLKAEAQDGSRVAALPPSWCEGQGQQGRFVRVFEQPGLAPGKKYTCTWLAIGGG